MQVVSAAVPSVLLAVGEALGLGVKTGVGEFELEALDETFPSFQSVPTSSTIGETSELSRVSLVIPV